MSKSFALVALLSACSADHFDSCGDGSSRLNAFLDAWIEARACLVEPAPDTLTGIRISALAGRDCSRELHRLEVFSGLAANGWTLPDSTIVTTSGSPEIRAKAIDDLDAGARSLGISIGRFLPEMQRRSLPLLPEPAPLFGGQAFLASFNGGFPHARQIQSNEDWAIGVDVAGNRLPYTQLVTRSRRSNAFRSIDTQDLSVLMWRPKGLAYALDVTPRGGVTKTTFVSGAIEGDWQDAKTGEVFMYVGTDRGVSIHRLRPGMSGPEIVPTSYLDTDFTKTCLHGGEVWGLRGETVVHATTVDWRQYELGGVSKGMQLDCRSKTALVLRHGPDVIERCEERVCGEVYRSSSAIDGVATLRDDGRWGYASSLADIVSIQSEGEPSQQYQLPSTHRLVALTEIESELILVVSEYGSSSYRGVTIPKPVSSRPVTARTQP